MASAPLHLQGPRLPPESHNHDKGCTLCVESA